MIKMLLSQAAALLNSSISTDISFHGISTDTRTLTPGNLYVAIRGDKFDGHAFIAKAQQAGASAAVVSHKIDSSLPQLVVTDTILALGKIAASWRARFSLPLIGLTGSNGKTTTKNMIASIL